MGHSFSSNAAAHSQNTYAMQPIPESSASVHSSVSGLRDSPSAMDLKSEQERWAQLGGPGEQRGKALNKINDWSSENTAAAETFVQKSYTGRPLALETALVTLRELNLSFLQLSSIPPLPELAQIDLSHNKLEDTQSLLAFIEKNPKLTILNLSFNQIKDLEPLLSLKERKFKQGNVFLLSIDNNPGAPTRTKSLAQMQDWNASITRKFIKKNEIGETHYLQSKDALFRAADEHPFNVFTPHGRLAPSGGIRDEGQTFGNALTHQGGQQDNRLSTTPIMKIAEVFAIRRPWVYVIDPQPHGLESNRIITAQGQRPYAHFEEEVQVPLQIKSTDIRGAYPVGEDGPEYENFIKNPHYDTFDPMPIGERTRLAEVILRNTLLNS